MTQKFIFACGLLLLTTPAVGQAVPPVAAVQSSCGSPTYIAGTNRPITQDTTGKQCVAGTVVITPSGTQDTNLKQVNGATVNVGVGAASTGTQRVTTSTDSTIGTVTTVTNPVGVKGADGSTIVSPTNALPSKLVVANASTYRTVVTGYGGYATPTDLMCIGGSGTKTVAVDAAFLLIGATAGVFEAGPSWIKRSTADTGGTPSSATLIPLDSNNAAATASVTYYGSAPTTGTVVGTLNVNPASVTATTAAPGTFTLLQNSVNGAIYNAYNQPIVLHGTAEQACFNWAGAALPAGFTATIVVEVVEY